MKRESKIDEKNRWVLIIAGLVGLLLLAMLNSCSPIKRFTRLTSLHPELIKTKVDTIKTVTLVAGKDSLITIRDTVNNKVIERHYRVDTIFHTVTKDNYIPDKNCGIYVNTLKQQLRDKQRERSFILDTTKARIQEVLKSKQLDKQIIRVQNRKVSFMDYIWYLLILVIGILLGRVSKTII